MGTTCGERFYAIYYTTEFKYIGRGDAFIAPKAGTYTFKLWGSPGGDNPYLNSAGNQYGGRGAYVESTIWLSKNQKIYAFVGSAGAAATGDTSAGGYNGGGPALVCLAGSHGASGGGATHISTTNNPIMCDVFVKIFGDTGTDSIPRYDGSVDGKYYNSDPIVMHYGRAFTGTKASGTTAAVPAASQAEIIAHIRQKLMADPYWKNYVKSDTVIQEVGGNEGEFKTGGNAAKIAYNSDTGRSDGQKIGRSKNTKAWFVVRISQKGDGTSAWDSSGTLAIAGGGGGGAQKKNVVVENKTDVSGSEGAAFSYAGKDIADSGANGNKRPTVYSSTYVAASNAQNTGYTKSAGQYCMNSSGGGGGWMGGYSPINARPSGKLMIQTKGGMCLCAGGGGTSYFKPDGTYGGQSYAKTWQMKSSTWKAGNDPALNTGTYRKPEANGVGINGYVVVEKGIMSNTP